MINQLRLRCGEIMIIVNAEFPAGLTIEQAISDALEFSESNHCMVRAELNDIKMTFVYGSGLGMSFDETVAYYADEFRRRLKEKTDFRNGVADE